MLLAVFYSVMSRQPKDQELKLRCDKLHAKWLVMTMKQNFTSAC